jgi:hypothetical protein
MSPPPQGAARMIASSTDPGVPKPKPPAAARPVHRIVEDNSSTEPSMPRFDPSSSAIPTTIPGTVSSSVVSSSPAPWAKGLAARIDQALDGGSGDEWGMETPVVAPTKAELRALLGSPDPTRKVSIDELERLHRAAAAEREGHDEELFQPRTRTHPTAEVDPDQIEAAIEVAPPARRNQNVVATAKPKKPE